MSVKTCSDFGRSMLEGPNRPEARNMLIELILSIPARLSDLLVVLTSLMRPLVMALQEGQELVGLGLRTLEYWVDRCLPSPLPPSNMRLTCCGVAWCRRALACCWSGFASCQGLLLPGLLCITTATVVLVGVLAAVFLGTRNQVLVRSMAVRCDSLFACNSQNQRLAVRLHPLCQVTMHFPGVLRNSWP